MKVWLSRENSGLYMMTYLKPDKHRVMGTDTKNFYVPYGDPLGVRHLCQPGIKAQFGIEIEVGEQIQVEFKK